MEMSKYKIKNMKKILVLDNYDSFTYNIVEYLRKVCNYPIEVHRNDQISLAEINRFDKIVLSPGPGIPDEAGILKPLIAEYASTKSIFGVCLGMQAIGEVFGGTLTNMNTVIHGVATNINVIDADEILFRNIPSQFKAGRYHSWIVNKFDLPDCLKITSVDDQGRTMSLCHKTFDVRGVQFHPESFMTEFGLKIIENWVNNY